MVFPLNQILNVSPNLQIAIHLKDYSSLPYFFFDDVEEHQFPSYCTTSYLNLGEKFFSTVTWVLQLHTVWNQKKIGLLILLNCEPVSLTVFTTMCSKEQQTSDNLIVKVVDSYWISSTEWSDTFRSFFVYGKEQESW